MRAYETRDTGKEGCWEKSRSLGDPRSVTSNARFDGACRTTINADVSQIRVGLSARPCTSSLLIEDVAPEAAKSEEGEKIGDVRRDRWWRKEVE